LFSLCQKNAAIPAIRGAVNFPVTTEMAIFSHFFKFWRLSYVKANFFNFMKKGHLKTQRENLTREFPSANPRLG
jgi:hypothetical protein